MSRGTRSRPPGLVHGLRASALLVVAVAGGWVVLWVFRLARAVLLPGNLQLELHWLEVGLLLVLGLDLLVSVVRLGRGGRWLLRLGEGRTFGVERPVVVGTAPGPAGLELAAAQVSRRHAEVRPDPGGLLVRDLGSTNGTSVNGVGLGGDEEVLARPGDVVELGLSGPRLVVEAVSSTPFLAPRWRFGLLLALVWAGLFLGWRSNVGRLPGLPVQVGDVAVDLGAFADGGVVLAVAAGLTGLLAVWTLLLGRRGEPLSAQVHLGIQLLLVLGVVVLYPLLPAEGLRYARAAERARLAVDAKAGAGAFEDLQGEARGEATPLQGRAADGDVRQRFASGARALRLATKLGAREGGSLLRVVWLRQLIGVSAGVVLFLLVPLAWPGASRLVSRAVDGLSRPLVRPGAGAAVVTVDAEGTAQRSRRGRGSPGARIRASGAFSARTLGPLLYGDVLLGLVAAVVVVVTVFSPLGTSLGRGKNLWLSVPGVGTVQSIEIVKALFLLFMASYFARVGRLLEVAPRARYLWPFLLATAGALAMTAVQADMGGLLMLGLLVSGVFILGSGAWRLLLTVPALVAAGLGLAALLGKMSIVTTRVQLWLDPRHHWGGSQVVEARQLLLSSGWSGFPPDRALVWRIADAHGDLMVAALAERYGLLGMVGLVAAWAAMVVALLVTARRMGRQDTAAALLLAGVAVLFLVQAATQCGGLLGLMPFTGVALPWLGHGMTASLTFTALVGAALAGAVVSPGAGMAVDPAVPAARMRWLVLGAGALLAVVAAAFSWWLVLAPARGGLGPGGRDYRWVDPGRVEMLQVLEDAGLFVRRGSSSRVDVDHDAYRRFRDAAPPGADPGLVSVVRIAQGMRWRGGEARPMPYMVSDPNRFAARELARGWILDGKGRVLAMNDERGRRLYPLGADAFHVIGVPRGVTEGSGLEAQAGFLLTGQGLGPGLKIQAFTHDVHHGADLALTLDADLQRRAQRLLGGRRGAVVVLDLEDEGAVLALASSPAPTPDSCREPGRTQVAGAADRPMLDRTIESTALYSPPGSTFKMVMAVAALRAGVDGADVVLCDGYDEDLDVGCARGLAHGKVDLATALTVSCNAYFGRLAVRLGPEAVQETARAMGLGEDLEGDLGASLEGVSVPVLPSRLQLGPVTIPNDRALARVGFGQGPVSVTPLAMARAGAVLATGGLLVEPRLVKAVGLGVVDPNGRRRLAWQDRVKAPRPRRVVERHVARQVERMLEAVFEAKPGTASHLRRLWSGPEGWRVSHSSPGDGWQRVRIAGKTGSASRTAGDKEHDAWIVAWAPSRKARVVVCVMLEDAGSGGREAGPVAVQMLREALTVNGG